MLAVLALALAGTAAGACGVVVAAFVRDLASAAFVALLIAVPFLLAALVGRTGTGVARLGNVFPFSPATSAVGAALDGGDVAGPLLHLALLGDRRDRRRRGLRAPVDEHAADRPLRSSRRRAARHPSRSRWRG